MFYLIDKPTGITSFDVIRSLRKTLQTKKMGHSGTLDPLASGCLLIATENSTKLLPLIEKASKEYLFRIDFTGTSASLDAGTEITPTDISRMVEKSDEDICAFILSQTSQIPPQYSALHIDGERAYNLARKGEVFDIPERAISVLRVSIEARTHTSIDLRILLSSGGYVRSFAPLIGEYLGVSGGYISSLRRTALHTEYGILRVEDAGELEYPKEIPYSKLFHTIPTVEIGDTFIEDLRKGRTISPNLMREALWGNHIFFINRDHTYISLCRYLDGTYTIEKNNV